MVQHDPEVNQSDREIVITRVFNAPPALVFKAWTEPEHIAQWWGPKGFTTRVDEMDVKPGGQWRYVMIGPDGTEYPSRSTFQEIVPPERIVTVDEFGEGIEQVVQVDLPQGKIITTALFENLDGKTKLTIQILHESVEDRRKHEAMGVIPGWNSSLDCLDEYLATLAENH